MGPGPGPVQSTKQGTLKMRPILNSEIIIICLIV
jgi:hypothetical protein